MFFLPAIDTAKGLQNTYQLTITYRKKKLYYSLKTKQL